jgi:hypothetical protein
MARLFNDTIRCYEDGRVERLYKKKGWVEVKPNPNSLGYTMVCVNKKMLLRHRIIAACYLGLDMNSDITVDHINRDRLDNRVENLRLATYQQQSFNTGAKGYTFIKRANKWQAAICHNNNKMYIGRYNTEAEASQAYLNAKELYHII